MEFIVIHHLELGLQSEVSRTAFEAAGGLRDAGWREGRLPGSEPVSPEPYEGGGQAFVIASEPETPAPKKKTPTRRSK